jgi:hypothetical protein
VKAACVGCVRKQIDASAELERSRRLLSW